MNESVLKIRSYLKHVISNNKTFLGYEREKVQLLNLLNQTIEHGESNSALLIGPRGVGKTMLLNAILDELQASEGFDSSAILVRLNGLLQTDDKLALKSITSQLNLENAINGKVFGSFAENLSFLLECLKTGQKETSKSIICILEEFDLFCGHHNQTLLYNLFDVSQSAQTPICILGITCRLDVIELFEKRVKSRYSHRQIFLFNNCEENSEFSKLQIRINKIRTLLICKHVKDVTAQAVTKWNKQIEALLTDEKFQSLMQRLLNISSAEQILRNIIILVLSKLNEKKTNLTVSDFEEELRKLQSDDSTSIIKDLSILELCLLISIKHHTEIYENQPFNFEMIFTRYTKFVNANSNVQQIQRVAVVKAFEHLQKIELITTAQSVMGTRSQKEYELFKLLVTSDQVIEAVKTFPNLPTELKHWAESSLM